MIWIDFLILGIIGISSLMGVMRGFFKEAISLSSWILAFSLSISLCDKLALILPDAIAQPQLRIAAAFVLLFIGTLVIGSLVGFLIGSFVQFAGLAKFDKSLGVVFGVLRGIIISCGVIIVLDVVGVSSDMWSNQSLIYPYFKDVVQWLSQYVPDQLASYIKL